MANKAHLAVPGLRSSNSVSWINLEQGAPCCLCLEPHCCGVLLHLQVYQRWSAMYEGMDSHLRARLDELCALRRHRLDRRGAPDRLSDLRPSSAAASRAFRCSMLPFLAPIDDLH